MGQEPGDSSEHLPAADRAVAAAPTGSAERVSPLQRLTAGATLPVPREPMIYSLTEPDFLGFSIRTIEELIAHSPLRLPYVRMTMLGRKLSPADYLLEPAEGSSVRDRVDAAKVARQLAAGATLVLQAVDTYHPGTAMFCRSLEQELGSPVFANAFLTPAQAAGFDAHYDPYDSFLVQLQGEKGWRIWKPPLPAPLPHQPWSSLSEEAHAAAVAGEPWLEYTLRAGEVLWLPRGWVHQGVAEGVSLHMTLAIRTANRDWLMAQIVDAFLAEPANREDPLYPLLTADVVTKEIEVTAARLLEWLARLDPSVLAERVLEVNRARLSPPPVEAIRLVLDPSLLERVGVRCWPALLSAELANRREQSTTHPNLGAGAIALAEQIARYDVQEMTLAEARAAVGDEAATALAELVAAGLCRVTTYDDERARAPANSSTA